MSGANNSLQNLCKSFRRNMYEILEHLVVDREPLAFLRGSLAAFQSTHSLGSAEFGSE